MEGPRILNILDDEGDVWGYAMGWALGFSCYFGGQQAAAGLTTQAESGSSRRRLYELRGGRRLHDTQQRVTGLNSSSAYQNRWPSRRSHTRHQGRDASLPAEAKGATDC